MVSGETGARQRVQARLSQPACSNGLGFCETPAAFRSKKVRALSIIAHQKLIAALRAAISRGFLGNEF